MVLKRVFSRHGPRGSKARVCLPIGLLLLLMLLPGSQFQRSPVASTLAVGRSHATDTSQGTGQRSTSFSSTASDPADVVAKTLVTTEFPIRDIEVAGDAPHRYPDIYLIAGPLWYDDHAADFLSQVQHVFHATQWTAESLFAKADYFRELAVRTEHGTQAQQPVLAYDHGVLLFAPTQNGSWTTVVLAEYPPDSFRYYPLDLLAADFNPEYAGEEILVLFEGAILDDINFQEFSYNSSSVGWDVNVTYHQSPVIEAACWDDFNTSHPGKELLGVEPEGLPVLFQRTAVSWSGTQLGRLEGESWLEAIVPVLFPVSLEKLRPIRFTMKLGFAAGGIGARKMCAPEMWAPIGGSVVIYSPTRGNWTPEIILMPECCRITTLAVAHLTDSVFPDIVAGDDEGNVWLVTQQNGTWAVRKLWHDTGAITAVRALYQGTGLIIGGYSGNLTELTTTATRFPVPASMTTTTGDTNIGETQTATRAAAPSATVEVFLVVLLALSIINRKRKKR